MNNMYLTLPFISIIKIFHLIDDDRHSLKRGTKSIKNAEGPKISRKSDWMITRNNRGFIFFLGGVKILAWVPNTWFWDEVYTSNDCGAVLFTSLFSDTTLVGFRWFLVTVIVLWPRGRLLRHRSKGDWSSAHQLTGRSSARKRERESSPIELRWSSLPPA